MKKLEFETLEEQERWEEIRELLIKAAEKWDKDKPKERNLEEDIEFARRHTE